MIPALTSATASAQDLTTAGWKRGISFSGQGSGLGFDDEGRRLVFGSSDGLSVLDVASGRVLRRIDGSFPSFAVAKGDRLAVSTRESLRIFKDLGATLVKTIKPAPKADLLVFSADGRWLFAKSAKAATLIELESGKRQALPAAKGGINSGAFSADGAQAVTADQAGELRLFEVATGKLIKTLTAPKVNFSGVAFRPDGAQLVTSDFFGKLRLWDVATGKEAKTVSTGQKIQRLALSGDGLQVVTGGWGGQLQLHDSATLERVGVLKVGSLVGSVAISAGGDRLGIEVGLGSSQVSVFSQGAPPKSLLSGARESLIGGFQAFAYSPDGKTLLASGGSRSTTALSLTGPLQSRRLGTSGGLALGWMPDGKSCYQVTGSLSEPVVTVHRIGAKEPLVSCKLKGNRFLAADLEAPASLAVLTREGSMDETVHWISIVDLSTGELVKQTSFKEDLDDLSFGVTPGTLYAAGDPTLELTVKTLKAKEFKALGPAKSIRVDRASGRIVAHVGSRLIARRLKPDKSLWKIEVPRRVAATAVDFKAGIAAVLGARGELVVVRLKDGTRVTSADGFLEKPGEPKNGRFMLTPALAIRPDGRQLAVSFLSKKETVLLPIPPAK